MSTEADIQFDSSNGCVTRNALLCCRSPVACLNYEPKLVHSATTKVQSPPTTTTTSTTTTTPATMAEPMVVPAFNAQSLNTGNTNGTKLSEPSSASPVPVFEKSTGATRSPHSATSSDDTDSPVPSSNSNAINKSKTMIDIRHGVTLRRVSPPRRPITIKQDGPLRDIVLRKVDRTTMLEPPKTPRFDKSPPPKKLTNLYKAKLHTASATIKSNVKQTKPIPKSKSTNDVALVAKQQAEKAAAAAAAAAAATAAALGKKKVPQINLLKTLRPLEIHKIEGDKIIIIRRVPKSKRPKDQPLPPLLDGDPQVIPIMLCKICVFVLTRCRLRCIFSNGVLCIVYVIRISMFVRYVSSMMNTNDTHCVEGL